MTENSEWPRLLADYKSLIEGFDGVSRTLSDALAKPGEANGQLLGLITAEVQARDAVVLARTRLMNLWRDSQADQRSQLPPSEAAQLEGQ